MRPEAKNNGPKGPAGALSGRVEISWRENGLLQTLLTNFRMIYPVTVDLKLAAMFSGQILL